MYQLKLSCEPKTSLGFNPSLTLYQERMVSLSLNHFNTRVHHDEVSKSISHKEQRKAKLKRGGRASEGFLKNPRAASLLAKWSADQSAVRGDPQSNIVAGKRVLEINAFFISFDGRINLALKGLNNYIC